MNNLELGVIKTCQMTHLTKMTMKGTSHREGVSMLLTNFIFTAYSQLPTVLNKLRTIMSGKSVHFPFRTVWVLYIFLQ